MKNFSSEKNDKKSKVTERSIELAERATLKKVQIFALQIRV